MADANNTGELNKDETRIAALESIVDGLSKTVLDLNATIGAQGNQLAEMSTRVSNLSNTVNAIGDGVKSHVTDDTVHSGVTVVDDASTDLALHNVLAIGRRLFGDQYDLTPLPVVAAPADPATGA